MGCSSSTATGALEPSRECDIIKIIKSLCAEPNKGAFGCFILKKSLTDTIISIIQEGNYDIILQYPKALSQKGRGNSLERALIGKTFKHKDVKLTHDSKEAFLKAVQASTTINGFKIFSETPERYNTFSREILRYREMMTDPVFFNTATTVRAINFKPYITIGSKSNKSLDKYNGVEADFISFSIKSNSSRIDFILSETCTPVITKKPGTTYITKQSHLPAFIKTLITDLHQLHKMGIYHLDIKPDNIVYCNGRYKFIDFGLSVSIPSPTLTTLTNVISAQIIYMQKKFTEFKGSPYYLNPIYMMIYKSMLVYIFSIEHVKNDLYKQHSQVIKSGVETFLNNYPQYINNSQKSFNITVFLKDAHLQDKGRTIASTGSDAIDLDNYYKFVTNFYRRADWFSLAITIDKILNNISGMMSISNKNAGIARLCNISDNDLDPEKTPYLDKILIEAFSPIILQGGSKKRSTKNKQTRI
jgi:serine/threonine protein kinase